MTCHYCRYSNSGDDHRCRRCGRRLGDAAPQPRADGANALAPQPAHVPYPSSQTAIDASVATLAEPVARTAQTSLFGTEAQNVIPFAVVRKLMTALVPPQPSVDLDETLEMRRPIVAPEIEQKKAQRKARTPAVENLQTALDFHAVSAAQSARMLKTTVEAVIYCDAPVAHPVHRVLAGALDFSMIAIATGIFAVTFHFLGGSVVWNRLTLILGAAALGAIALLYGLLWTIAGRESAGMRTMQLKLINFDGLPPDARSRAVRLLGTILSFCSGGLGIIWALFDEEDLAWHDHMSKTFPTLDEGRVYLRARKL
ncbi:MAG TPA: hypothetical protein DEQ47_04460 [Solibacterales bacterium]|jgi:uncharacterized RDD family membrane protein YckC|nr:hypothetical protein [Bryobacterales bacterium]